MFVKTVAIVIKPFLWLLNLLIPVGDLIARIWLAQIFLRDGWYKLQDWNHTVKLFSDHSWVSPAFSAGLTVAAEIILPILLILGLGGRIIIFLFLVFNVITMYSYNFIWTPEGATNLNQQIAWGMVLMLLMLHGSGKISLDHWLHKKHGHYLKQR